MITNSKPQADQARLEGPSMLETPGSVDLCIDGKLETWLRNGRLRISHETPPPESLSGRYQGAAFSVQMNLKLREL